jgi:hypothetical protein
MTGKKRKESSNTNKPRHSQEPPKVHKTEPTEGCGYTPTGSVVQKETYLSGGRRERKETEYSRKGTPTPSQNESEIEM